MAKQTNTPEDWRILAERYMDVADNMTPIKDFLQKEIPELFQ
jgi:hypothetical protein